nr:immunoglobulin heavy chain junction region [Mus musculus]
CARRSWDVGYFDVW